MMETATVRGGCLHTAKFGRMSFMQTADYLKQEGKNFTDRADVLCDIRG